MRDASRPLEVQSIQKKKSESILQNTLVKPQFLEQACGFSQARPHHPDKQG